MSNEPEQCTESSYRAPSRKRQPYGPGGWNRCVKDAAPDHGEHMDDFGNVFVMEPKFKVIKRFVRGEYQDA